MNNLVSLWQGLTRGRKVFVGLATVGMFLAILGLARMGNSVGQSLLYAGLDPRSAGEVIAALDQSGTVYEVRGDSIYVPADARDALRMQLAAQGLPLSGGAGYELLDGLTGFGTTAQMFDAAYWRAKEGELARTILAMPNVRAARVHISQQSGGMFSRDAEMSASVTVTAGAASITPVQADALRHLVASAVGGMQAADVAVIDSAAGLIGEEGGLSQPAESRAEEIRANVERLLAARVGRGKAVVEVTVDLVREREEITERKIDPQGRVAISSETEEASESATEPAGDVTVASNLPTGDAGAGGNGQSQSSNTRERVNFDVSATERQVLREPGAIRRLTVAVLVDGETVTAADGSQSWQPRSDEEMADLRELVSSAAGLDETRGDVLTIKTMQLTPDGDSGTLAEAGIWSKFAPVDTMSAIQLLVLGLVSVLLGLFVVRPLLSQARGSAGGMAALPAPAGAADFGGLPALSGELADGDGFAMAPFPVFDGGMNGGERAADPVERLKQLIEERQTESAEILRGWLEKQEERG